MMTLDEAIAKATKLLNLSKSSNANEAALAAQRAQEILARYSIDMATLDASGEAPQKEEDISREFDPLDRAQRKATWRVTLASKVANVNAVRIYTSGGDTMMVGRASDVAKVRYLFSYLSGEIERLTRALALGQGRGYANSFRIGAVMAIGESLKAAQASVAAKMRSEAQASSDAHALVRIDAALAKVSSNLSSVDAWMRAHMNLRSSRRSMGGNGSGYGAGYAAGQSVNVGGGARAALGSGQGKLRG